jgi:disulfide bond formation protein DsbB
MTTSGAVLAADVDAANAFFTTLTILVNVVVVGAVVVFLGGLTGVKGRRLAERLGDLVGPHARALAWLVAVVAMSGSLYYSEIADFTPCLLCWYQRIVMYPLAAILTVGLVRRDSAVRWYALPFVVVGAPLALYHWLVERVPSLAEGVSCNVSAPCAVPWFEELGYVTLAFMDLSAFLVIGTLLVIDWRTERRWAATDLADLDNEDMLMEAGQ